MRRKRSRELRFGEFAPESSAFFWSKKKCENGSKTFEVIWIYYERARNNLARSYTIWKTKTRRTKCDSFHFLKLQQIKMNYIGNAKGRKILEAKPTSDEFCHKFGRKLWFSKFFNMLSESVRDICMTNPELLSILKIVEFRDWTRKQFFLADNG